MTGELTARRVVVRGRVQGVFFRVSTQERADALGVTGWVRNRDDGAVEGWLEGVPDAVAALETWMRDGGPVDARVSAFVSQPVAPVGHRRFEVRT